MKKTYFALSDILKHRDEVQCSYAPLHRIVINEFIYSMNRIPAAKVEPVKYGKWIPASDKPEVKIGMKCSLCGARIKYSEYFNGNHNYCHKCGAKMLVD